MIFETLNSMLNLTDIQEFSREVAQHEVAWDFPARKRADLAGQWR